MPICVHCTNQVPVLYTVYQTAHNLRLEQCEACKEFADPYVEHDSLLLLMDLILLKRDVFRHLLFNRGTRPRSIDSKSEAKIVADNFRERTQAEWGSVLRLGAVLLLVDAFIRWSDTYPLPSDSTSREAADAFLRTYIACLVETIAFHGGVLLSCSIILPISRWAISRKPSGTTLEFRFSQVPLTLFYSSFTKLFLLFLLTIWKPSRAPLPSTAEGGIFESAFQIFDDDKLDREWLVRNVLGGMAAGFGLRVVLDCHPIFTTLIILVGWLIKTIVAGLIARWISAGLNEEMMAYSIP